MTAWSSSNHPRHFSLRHSITLVLAAVAVCLLIAAGVRALVGPPHGGKPRDDVTSESIPEPATDDGVTAQAERKPSEEDPGVSEPVDSPAFVAVPVPVRAAPPVTDDGGMDASPDANIPQTSAPIARGPMDAGLRDAGPPDAAPIDAGPIDAGIRDAGPLGASLMIPSSASCGRNTCNVGELCCNASCGTCVQPGQRCDAARTCSGDIEYIGESQMCGMQTCNVGYECCNPSCGTCKRPGEPCSQTPCT